MLDSCMSAQLACLCELTATCTCLCRTWGISNKKVSSVTGWQMHAVQLQDPMCKEVPMPALQSVQSAASDALLCKDQ